LLMLTIRMSKDIKKLAFIPVDKLSTGLIQQRDEVLGRPSGATNRKDDLVHSFVRAAAATVGFVSEAFHHRKDKKTPGNNAQIHLPPGPEDGPVLKDLDEALWAIDDAEGQTTTHQTASHSSEPKEPSDPAKAFLKRHPFQPSTTSDKGLELPVVLVQRRPKKRARGFVRAYAPDLASVGIGQEAFLDFIDTLNKVLEPNPWLYAINLAGFAEHAVPEPAMMLLGIGVGIATEALMEAQSRFQSNNFLDRVNSELFIPRGLVCLVVTWNPGTRNDGMVTAVSFDETAVKIRPETGAVTMIGDSAQKLPSDTFFHRIRDGVQKMTNSSRGTLGWVKPAPLIFPSLEETVRGQEENGKGKKNIADRAGRWIDEYMDKRAQAKWIEANHDLPMATSLPEPGFQSRYADPNHPASSGDIVALVTGGRWQYKDTKPTGSDTADSKADSRTEWHGDDAAERREENNNAPSSTSRSSKVRTGGLASLLQQVR
jgi:hypothetical protein